MRHEIALLIVELPKAREERVRARRERLGERFAYAVYKIMSKLEAEAVAQKLPEQLVRRSIM